MPKHPKNNQTKNNHAWSFLFIKTEPKILQHVSGMVRCNFNRKTKVTHDCNFGFFRTLTANSLSSYHEKEALKYYRKHNKKNGHARSVLLLPSLRFSYVQHSPTRLHAHPLCFYYGILERACLTKQDNYSDAVCVFFKHYS